MLNAECLEVRFFCVGLTSGLAWPQRFKYVAFLHAYMCSEMGAWYIFGKNLEEILTFLTEEPGNVVQRICVYMLRFAECIFDVCMRKHFYVAVHAWTRLPTYGMDEE